MKIRTPLHAAHPGTRISEGCPWPLRAEGAPQGHREENNHLYLYIYIYNIYKSSICPLTCNAVRFMLCWFTGVFGILLVLACFGLFFHFLMLSMQFLLLASHFHFPSVLDLCVIFSVVAQPFLAFFFLTARLRTFVAQLLSSLLLVSYLFASTQRKEAQCARQTKTNQLVATHGGVTRKHAPCQRPFNKDLWK